MDAVGIGNSLTQILRPFQLQPQIGPQHLFHIFTDAKFAEILQIRDTFEKKNTLDILIGVLHFVDGFVVLNIVEAHQAPIFKHSRMKKVLINCD
ncbi:hypothetical protein UUU_39400 [Klebsiella pneumoniae subsp. pneumoniae DSM 30104 = JCM 1662 = NBRC 14940]|nr:hypothetical protein UUU_39400 [Klebsiella pneumoniae subsp. pneumoniae DSM 30104 = JCM 1662 = NBRC 14940]